jgi:hypothetical protein
MASLTIVTGFLDIGRDRWSAHGRTLEKYFSAFRNTLQLHNHMVIWVEPGLVDRVREWRSSVPEQWRTTVLTWTLEECRLWCQLGRITEIMTDYAARKDWACPAALIAPEYCQPLYDVVVNQKLDWVKRAKDLVEASGHSTLLYAWTDAGYSANTIQLANHSMVPDPSECLGKVHATCLWPLPFPHDMNTFIRRYPIDVVDGGFVCVDAQLVDQLHGRYYALIDRCLAAGIVDDDQFFMTFAALEWPEVFAMPVGDWFGSARRYLRSSESELAASAPTGGSSDQM